MADVFGTAYDFIVCGAGTSGSVVARRLAEQVGASVLLVEAGGAPDHEDVFDAARWRYNLGSERDWLFHTEPNPRLGGRAIDLSMGKLLGGGSSINAMGWAHGHASDWAYFAEVSGEPAWAFEAGEALFHELEHWHGPNLAGERGRGGMLSVYAPPDSASARSVLDAAAQMALPVFDSLNGALWQSEIGGAARYELRAHHGRRQLIYDDYVAAAPEASRPTVLTHALVRRVLVEQGCAVGVELLYKGALHRVEATREVILSLGAVNTPRVLLQSGIGAEDELAALDVPVVQVLPGVGKNLQDHVLTYGFVWERQGPKTPEEQAINVGLFGRSRSGLLSPDFACIQFDATRAPPELKDKISLRNPFSLVPALVRPASRGRVSLRSTAVEVPPVVDLNYFEQQEDFLALTRAVEFAFDLAAVRRQRPWHRFEVVT